jgi:hypothetical protein
MISDFILPFLNNTLQLRQFNGLQPCFALFALGAEDGFRPRSSDGYFVLT